MFLIETFLLCSSVPCLSVCLFVYIIVEQWRRGGGLLKCELVGGLTLSNLFCCCTLDRHINGVPIMDTMLSNYQNTPLYLVSVVDCTHVGSAMASFEELVALHRRTLQMIFG